MSSRVVTYKMMTEGGYGGWRCRYLSKMQAHAGQDKSNPLTKKEQARLRAINKAVDSLRREINVLNAERNLLEKKVDFKCGHPLEKMLVEEWTGHDTLGNFSNSSEITIKCGGCNKELEQFTEW